MLDKLIFVLPASILAEETRDYSQQLNSLESFFQRFRAKGVVCMLLCHTRDMLWLKEHAFDNIYPLEGEEALRQWLSSQDGLYVVWNGLDDPGCFLAQTCLEYQRPLLRLEYGYLPQLRHIQWDYQGVIGGMSVDRAAIESVSMTDVLQWENSFSWRYQCRAPMIDALQAAAVLQTDRDSSLVIFSKFPTTREFLAHLESINWLSGLSVRRHPRQPDSELLLKDFQPKAWLPIDTDPLVQMRAFDIIVGVNSSLLTEAAALGWPILPFGKMPGSELNIYPNPHEITCMEDALDFWMNSEVDVLRRKWLWWLANIKQWNVGAGPSNRIIEYICNDSCRPTNGSTGRD